MKIEVLQGDSADVLRTLEAESVEAMITDPPAGIGFFDAPWDSDKGGRDAWISWLAGIMSEALRVMKPGAHGLVWALPRTSGWTQRALEDAGFEIRDVVVHLFAQGYPKSTNLAKAIDKRRDDRAGIVKVTGWIAEARDAASKTNAAIDDLFGTHGMAGHWTTTGSQPAVPTPEQWARLLAFLEATPPAEIAAEFDRLSARKGQHGDAYLEAEVIGQHGQASRGGVVDFLRSAKDVDIRKPSERAETWAGWGTALKPSSEHWILVRKPMGRVDGNPVRIADCVTRHGTGAINIDATRIPTDWQEADRPPSWKASGHAGAEAEEKIAAPKSNGIELHPGGRWPPNTVISHAALCREIGDRWDCVPGCAVRELVGSAPDAGLERFFPCFRYYPKPKSAETEAGADAIEAANGRHNDHPTRKPIDLMRWMIRLLVPKGGRVLDPFAGSGTTGCAAALEQVSFVGVELDPRYAEIARARIAWWSADFRAVQQSLF